MNNTNVNSKYNAISFILAIGNKIYAMPLTYMNFLAY